MSRRKKWGNGCWAGTRKAVVALRVRVEQFKTVSAFPPVVHGYTIRPYLIRTRSHLPVFQDDHVGHLFQVAGTAESMSWGTSVPRLSGEVSS
jgi:hypothetical protein